ncbi:hypothetical protein NAT47_07395 [Flavobacterium sp. HXWNR69]|uniref:DUF2231 domain-containing protein n=1 Tax=Flavobacterium fragile TaxID=2949085 RepID=A0ABT0THC7_9FLAO|nr:hypothetical protein [Flavobacterium sp. HXWNR69]MCL9770238.1 hypothetical protein [Flavobacterium sp. HXWNR69]
MNEAHLHMVVNHFPIIGTIFGLGVLVTGIFLKNNVVKNVAYVLFIVAAIFGAVSMATGEGAEEIAENLPSVTEQFIHEHEEMAEKLAIVLYALGLVSLIGLYLNIKNHAKANLVSYLAAVIAIAGVFIGKQTGTTGGEIRHTEIRANAASVAVPAENNGNETEGDDH